MKDHLASLDQNWSEVIDRPSKCIIFKWKARICVGRHEADPGFHLILKSSSLRSVSSQDIRTSCPYQPFGSSPLLTFVCPLNSGKIWRALVHRRRGLATGIIYHLMSHSQVLDAAFACHITINKIWHGGGPSRAFQEVCKLGAYRRHKTSYL